MASELRSLPWIESFSRVATDMKETGKHTTFTKRTKKYTQKRYNSGNKRGVLWTKWNVPIDICEASVATHAYNKYINHTKMLKCCSLGYYITLRLQPECVDRYNETKNRYKNNTENNNNKTSTQHLIACVNTSWKICLSVHPMTCGQYCLYHRYIAVTTEVSEIQT